MSHVLKKVDFQSRSEEEEMMDETEISDDLLHRSLGELEKFNRYLGGWRTSIDAVRRLLPEEASTVSILDIGTGGGDVAARLYDTLRADGIRPEILGVDLLPGAIRYARREYGNRTHLEFVTGDFRDVDSPDGDRWDLVHSSLVLHHFQDHEIPEMLRAMNNRSRRGIIINDLHRHPFAFHAIRILTRVLVNNRMIQNDAPLSVRRSFTRDELRSFIQEAGLPDPEIHWYWAFRWQVLIQVNRQS